MQEEESLHSTRSGNLYTSFNSVYQSCGKNTHKYRDKQLTCHIHIQSKVKHPKSYMSMSWISGVANLGELLKYDSREKIFSEKFYDVTSNLIKNWFSLCWLQKSTKVRFTKSFRIFRENCDVAIFTQPLQADSTERLREIGDVIEFF